MTDSEIRTRMRQLFVVLGSGLAEILIAMRSAPPKRRATLPAVTATEEQIEWSKSVVASARKGRAQSCSRAERTTRVSPPR